MNWISIDEQLPEACADVLLCDDTDKEIAIGWRAEDGGWATWHEPRCNVTHWMPLPELPAARA